MSRIHRDAVHLEHVLHLFHHNTSCRFDAISVGNSMNVVRVEFVQVEDLIELEHGLLIKKDIRMLHKIRFLSANLLQC